jgi:hypothetical protein
MHRRVVVGFKVVRVFDEAALVRPPADPDVAPTRLAGQAPEQLIDGLEHQIAGAGFHVVDQDCSPANGQTDFATRTVLIRPDLETAQRAKTLAHELAHVRLHDPAHLDANKWSRHRKEVEAESVAYLVCSQAGLDSSGYTIPYVALWSGGDLQLVADTAERVVETARGIGADLTAGITLTEPQPGLERSRSDGIPNESPRPALTGAVMTDPLAPATPSLDTQRSPAGRLDADAGAIVRHLAANVDQWTDDPETKAAMSHLVAGIVPPAANDNVSAARAQVRALIGEPPPRPAEPPGIDYL